MKIISLKWTYFFFAVFFAVVFLAVVFFAVEAFFAVVVAPDAVVVTGL